jgi:hypothetical protein
MANRILPPAVYLLETVAAVVGALITGTIVALLGLLAFGCA